MRGTLAFTLHQVFLWENDEAKTIPPISLFNLQSCTLIVVRNRKNCNKSNRCQGEKKVTQLDCKTFLSVSILLIFYVMWNGGVVRYKTNHSVKKCYRVYKHFY